MMEKIWHSVGDTIKLGTRFMTQSSTAGVPICITPADTQDQSVSLPSTMSLDKLLRRADIV